MAAAAADLDRSALYILRGLWKSLDRRPFLAVYSWDFDNTLIFVLPVKY